jgi:enoyl-CoA hydratase
MDYETVTTELNDAGVLKVMLNRPERRNALSAQLWEDLDAALCDAVTRDEVKVILLGGHGKAFSSGADLKEGDGRRNLSQSEYERSLRTHSFDMPVRWRNLPRPTIAMVHGACLMNAFAIVQSMDIIIAGDDATFVPGLTPYLSWAWYVPTRIAKEIMYEPRAYTAQEAKDLGLINRVVPADRLVEVAEAFAAGVAAKPQERLAEVKRQMNRIDDLKGLYAGMEMSWNDYWARRRQEPPDIRETTGGKPRIAQVADAFANRDAAGG